MKTPVLSQLFLWQGLSPADIARCLAALSPPGEFEKGAVVYSAQKFPRAFAVVLEGKVLVQTHSGASVRTLGPGEVFGVTALFGGERYASEITVLSRARLQFIEEALLRQWMAEFPEVSMNYIRFLHQRIGFLNEKIRTFTESSVQKRVLGFLESHAPPGGEIRIPGGMAALARELNIGHTSLYRALEALEEKNKIYKKGQKWYREER